MSNISLPEQNRSEQERKKINTPQIVENLARKYLAQVIKRLT